MEFVNEPLVSSFVASDKVEIVCIWQRNDTV